MSTKERYEKYIKEHCPRCKNKEKYDCEIRICWQGDITVTRCEFYERNDCNK